MTRGTDPRSHHPWWLWDGVNEVKVQQVTGAWPRQGPLREQPASLVRLIRWLTEVNLLRRNTLLG